MNILVSACLLGINCKYNGKNNLNDNIMRMREKHTLIPVCPEQLGGLDTPRFPSEICKNAVINNQGEDVTVQYKKGAKEVLKIAKMCNCNIAILKERSPACGSKNVYDGTFSKTLIEGMGICARLLHDNGIEVHSEEDEFL